MEKYIVMIPVVILSYMVIRIAMQSDKRKDKWK